jgi:hypothetical protein
MSLNPVGGAIPAFAAASAGNCVEVSHPENAEAAAGESMGLVVEAACLIRVFDL